MKVWRMVLPKNRWTSEAESRRRTLAWRPYRGAIPIDRRTVGGGRALYPRVAEAAISVSGPHSHQQSPGVDRHSLCLEDRHSLGGFAARDGLRLRDELLAATTGLERRGNMGGDPSGAARFAEPGQPDRLVARHHRQLQRPRRFWGDQTGPNPTDRRKAGTKHHVLTDGHGIPLATTITGANRHDVTQLIPLIDAIPPIYGQPGRPRHRPDAAYADRAYDSQPHRRALRQRGIAPHLARRRTEHGTGLGKKRWVVERTHSWLHQNRRLRVRYEKRADIHEAFLKLACIRICLKKLKPSFC